jgi:hypothetical protein
MVQYLAPLRVGLLVVAIFGCVPAALADEGGVSFWLPGTFGSLAAVPQQPGWSAAGIYYHTSVSASGAVAAEREVTIGRLPRTASVDLNVNLHADVDLFLPQLAYTFAAPVLGGQLQTSLTGIVGRNRTSLDGTLTAMSGGLVASRTGSLDSSVSGFGDLYPQVFLRWNMGVHNVMTYLTGDIPVGAYDKSRLANLGIGHGAIDGGVGYTYLDPKTGREFSAVTGLTYNLKNLSTDYQNGIDWHLDWGASQYISKQMFVGAVGYFYNQITPDSGQLAFLGANESRVIAVGPQIGFLFPVGNMQGYLSVKGYGEFDAFRRPSGWNTWLTFAISPTSETASTKSMMVHK